MSRTNFNDEERAPLELTKASSKLKLLVCPNCKTARYYSIDCAGFICKICKNYVRAEDCLPESDAENTLNDNKIIDPKFIKLKEDMEKKAYAYKDKVLADKKAGRERSHEPGGAPKKW